MINISYRLAFLIQIAKMKQHSFIFKTTYLFIIVLCLYSCSIIEKSSVHSFDDGYYLVSTDSFQNKKLYVSISEEEIVGHTTNEEGVKEDQHTFRFQMNEPNQPIGKISFKKSSLDIDISSVLLKYRPSVYGLPAQLTTDFNLALYGGWRKDMYQIFYETSPIGTKNLKQNHRGYDVCFFAGVGNTLVGPFSTRSVVTDEYNGLILQSGIAGFLETGFASFGLAGGVDQLTGPNGKDWIYQRKWWIGFMIGIALN
jgi:hypothetical protein